MGGVLAVWNNRVDSDEAEYESWYQEEHVPQRLAFAGFRQARRYEAIAADRRYFTWYALDDLAVLREPAYLACLDDPTPRTRAAMPRFRDMVRAELAVAASNGRGIGGFAVCLRLDADLIDVSEAATWFRMPGVTAVHAWTAPPGPAPAMSSEVRFRGAPDGSSASALVVECMRDMDAKRIADRLAMFWAGKSVAHIGSYKLLCCTDAG